MAVLAAAWLAPAAHAYLYWAHRGNETGTTLGRANLNGTGVNQSFIGGATGPVGVAVDSAHIYWANTFGAHESIGRANLDGSEANQSFITGGNYPCGVAVDDSHIYWTNASGNSIGRANLNGTGVNQSFITVGVSHPCGVAVDESHIYWANQGTGFPGNGTTIGRASLNGSSPEGSFIEGADGPVGVVVNSSYVYWANTNETSNTIGRANLNGTGVNQSFITGGDCPDLPAVDDSHIYWTNACSDTIGRANLDGSEANQSFIATLQNPGGVALDVPAPEATPTTPTTPSPSNSKPKKSKSKKPSPADFSTALFDGKALYIRLKCPARFKPRCAGKAQALSGAGKRAKAITNSTSAGQKQSKWRVVKLTVKPKFRKLVARLAAQPDKKLLTVRQVLHAKRFRHGRVQVVLHKYKVHTA
jgi:hypothetical protein